MKEVELPLEHESISKIQKEKIERSIERSRWISRRVSCQGVNGWISGVTTQKGNQPNCPGAKGPDDERYGDQKMNRWNGARKCGVHETKKW